MDSRRSRRNNDLDDEEKEDEETPSPRTRRKRTRLFNPAEPPSPREIVGTPSRSSAASAVSTPPSSGGGSLRQTPGSGRRLRGRAVAEALASNDSNAADEKGSTSSAKLHKTPLMFHSILPALQLPPDPPITARDIAEILLLRSPNADSRGPTPESLRRLERCLSSSAGPWAVYEWFYPNIDRPFFSQNEFHNCLAELGYGQLVRLKRNDWGQIRRVMGKPRRLSPLFLKEERERLAQHRFLVRSLQHLKGMPPSPSVHAVIEVPGPFQVGDRIVGVHPQTKVPAMGRVSSVVGNGDYEVRFDRHASYPPATHTMADTCLVSADVPRVIVIHPPPPSEHQAAPSASASAVTASVSSSMDAHAHAHAPTLDVAIAPAAHPSTVQPLSEVAQHLDGTAGGANGSGVEGELTSDGSEIVWTVRLYKLLRQKSVLVSALHEMNSEAEHLMGGDTGAPLADGFREKYSWLIVQLEHNDRALADVLTRIRQIRNMAETDNEEMRAMRAAYENGIFTSTEHTFQSFQSSATSLVSTIAVAAANRFRDAEGDGGRVEQQQDGTEVETIAEGTMSMSTHQPPLANTMMDDVEPHVTSLDGAAMGENSSGNMMDSSGGVAGAYFKGPAKVPGATAGADDLDPTVVHMVSTCMSILLMLQTFADRPSQLPEINALLDKALAALAPHHSHAGLRAYREIESLIISLKTSLSLNITLG